MPNRINDLDDLAGYSAWIEVVKAYARCQRLLTRELDGVGLSTAQHEVLVAVARDEGLSQKQVAARLLVTKSNVTALLDRLEKSGWVTRTPHPEDARSRCVFLTPAGRRLFKRAVKKHAAVVQLMTQRLRPAELSMLQGVMKTVVADLDMALKTSRR